MVIIGTFLVGISSHNGNIIYPLLSLSSCNVVAIFQFVIIFLSYLLSFFLLNLPEQYRHSLYTPDKKIVILYILIFMIIKFI